jgi:serine/threonine protein phosphatase PrpC
MSHQCPPPYSGINEQRNTEDLKMTTTNLLKSLLITALLVSVTSHAAEQQPIVIALEEGKQIASFNVGDSRCVLKNDQIRCVPVHIK